MPPQPGMAERAIDTATDVSHSIAEATAALKLAVERLSDTVKFFRPEQDIAPALNSI
jgi:hypothetical protein